MDRRGVAPTDAGGVPFLRPVGGKGAGRAFSGLCDVAIVHDYLTQRGGAERVVLLMLAAFPEACVHTAFFDPSGTYPEFPATSRIRPFPIDRVAPLRRHHRATFPVLAPMFAAHRVDARVVVCSSSGWAHGVRTDGRKIVYCHAPARWLYQSTAYLRGRNVLQRGGLRILKQPLRRWDQRAASSADRYIANSTAVRDQIRAVYGVDAEVLPPPPNLDNRGPRCALPGLDPGFLLVVSRLLPYKNVDAIVEAVRGRPEQLVVVGAGPEAASLQAHAGPNVCFLGQVADDELRWLYANASALVSASFEDFGLTTLEAASFGTPTLALRFGGFLDTIVEGTTGLLFDEPDARLIRAGLDQMGQLEWHGDRIEKHASCFDEEAFADRLREVVAEELRAA